MSTLFIGDLHYCPRNLRYLNIVEEEIISIAKKEGGFAAIVLLGDIFDKHKVVDVVSFSAFSAFVKDLLNYAKEKLVILIGNHDRMGTSFRYEEHFLTFPNFSDKIVVVNTSTVVRCSEFKFVAMPFHRSQIDMLIGLEPIYSDLITSDFVVAHQHFTGCANFEMDWPLSLPPVISGHAHDKFNVRNLYYPGTPYQISFGENTVKYLAYINIPSTHRMENNPKLVVRLPGLGAHFTDINANPRADVCKYLLKISEFGKNVPRKYTYHLDITNGPKLEEFENIIAKAKEDDEHHIKLRYLSSQKLDIDSYSIPRGNKFKLERICVNDFYAKKNIGVNEKVDLALIISEYLTKEEMDLYRTIV